MTTNKTLSRSTIVTLCKKGGLRRRTREKKIAINLSGAQLGLLERIMGDTSSGRRLVIGAMEMGTGKTLAALATLCALRGQRKNGAPVRALFVVPKSTLYDAWRRQLRQFTHLGVDDLRVVTYPRLQTAFLKSWSKDAEGGWVKNSSHALLDSHRDLVVFDESHTLRNPNTILGRAASLVSRQAPRVLCLTGTPVHNGPEDASGQLRAMNSGSSLEDPAVFGRRACMEQEAVRTFSERFLYTASLKDAGVELKKKHLDTIWVNHAFNQEHAAQYNESLSAIQGMGAVTTNMPVRIKHHMLILRQLCVEPALFHKHGRPTFDDEARRLTVASPGPKLRAAIACVRRLVYQGHSKVVIVSEFVTLLDVFKDLAREQLGEESLSFDGRLGAAARGKLVSTFLSGDHRLLCLSLGAGAYGLDLTPSSAMVVLDVWFNPQVHRQVEARIYRPGMKKEVSVQILITKDSVEAAIYATHKEKEACAAEIITGRCDDQLLRTQASRIAELCEKVTAV
jgi:SNF2 family DNA or RNA helicase